MELKIYGQKAIDDARQAMRDNEEVHLFENRYRVVKVTIYESYEEVSPSGFVSLICMSKPVSRAMNALVSGSRSLEKE